jgi:hypothetical protein
MGAPGRAWSSTPYDDGSMPIARSSAATRSARRWFSEDLEDGLRGDSAFEPLQIRTARALGAADGHKHVGGAADPVVALDGIPEEVTGDEHIGVVTVASRLIVSKSPRGR